MAILEEYLKELRGVPLTLKLLKFGVRLLNSHRLGIKDQVDSYFPLFNYFLIRTIATFTRGTWRAFKENLPENLKRTSDLLLVLNDSLSKAEDISSWLSETENLNLIRSALLSYREEIAEIQKVCYSRAPMVSHELLALLEDILNFLDRLKREEVGPPDASLIFLGEPSIEEVLENYRRAFQGGYVFLPEVSEEEIVALGDSIAELVSSLKSLMEVVNISDDEVTDLQEYISNLFIRSQAVLTALAVEFQDVLEEIARYSSIWGVNYLFEGKKVLKYMIDAKAPEDNFRAYTSYLRAKLEDLIGWYANYLDSFMIKWDGKRRYYEEASRYWSDLSEILAHPEAISLERYEEIMTKLLDSISGAISQLRKLTIYPPHDAMPSEIEENPNKELLMAAASVPYLQKLLNISYNTFSEVLEDYYIEAELEKLSNFWKNYHSLLQDDISSEEAQLLRDVISSLENSLEPLRDYLTSSGLFRKDLIVETWERMRDNLDKVLTAQEIISSWLEMEPSVKGSETPQGSGLDSLRSAFAQRFKETSSIEYEFSTKMGKELKLLVEAARKGKPHKIQLKLMLNELKAIIDNLMNTLSSHSVERLTDEEFTFLLNQAKDFLAVVTQLEKVLESYLETEDISALNPADLLIESFDFKAIELDRLLSGVLNKVRDKGHG